MTLIVCVDSNGTILFNKRRVSRDAAVISDIISNHSADGSPLMVLPYSKSLFNEYPVEVIDSLDEIKEYTDRVLFAESSGLSRLNGFVTTVVLYVWDKVYPKGESFDLDLSDYSLISEIVITGKSHKEIVRRVYAI